jgi:hypothetical protein
MRYPGTAVISAAALALAVGAAAAQQMSGGYVLPVASGQGHCAETVAFTYSPAGGAPQFAQRKTGTVCGKQDQGKTGSMPATEPAGPQPDGSKLLEVSAPARAQTALWG